MITVLHTALFGAALVASIAVIANEGAIALAWWRARA